MRGSRRLPLERLHRRTSKGSQTKIKAHAGRMGKSVNKLTNRASAETKGRPGMIPRALALSKRAAIRGFIGLSAKGGAPSIVDEAPQLADKARKRKNCPEQREIRGNFCFLRQLHMQPAVTYVYVSSLACKFASLSCRLFHPSGSLLTLSTS